MILTDHEKIEKYAKEWKHCIRNAILRSEDEWTCVAWGCNIIKKKNDLTKISKKKNKFL